MHQFFFSGLKPSIQCLAYKHVDEVFFLWQIFSLMNSLTWNVPSFFNTCCRKGEGCHIWNTRERCSCFRPLKGPPVTSSNFLCRNLPMNLSFPSSLNCVFGHETEACNYHFYFDNNINEEDSAKPIMHRILWFLSFFLYFK